ncbi:hypothetical protein HYT25_03180 [Candidatus Pacearchaeota archaeon]|nr:hypothetical protein [Candidatus Pacearchaeota archaeon]
MRISDYVFNRTCEYSGTEFENNLYQKLYAFECSFFGEVAFQSATIYDRVPDSLLNVALLTSTIFLAGDVVVRGIVGNHRERATSGIVGLTRDLFQKLRK